MSHICLAFIMNLNPERMLLGEVENSPRYIHFNEVHFHYFQNIMSLYFSIHVEFDVHCVYIRDERILEASIFVAMQS